MKKQTIAILGATSHIAKSLTFNFLQEEGFELHLFARSPERVKAFIDSIGHANNDRCVIHDLQEDLLGGDYDVVVNCVGVGTANKLQGDYSKYFTVTEEYDNRVLRYLKSGHSDTLYVSFSSGSVYGGGFSEPANDGTVHCIPVNHIEPKDYYSIVRLNAEAKHRSMSDLNIVDLRVFAFFSRFIDLSDGYFITDVIDNILKGTSLITSDSDFVRDYIHPRDLFALVVACIKTRTVNSAFDVISAAPVTKNELLNYFSTTYGLQYSVSSTGGTVSATGSKSVYYSAFHNAERIGYKPQFTAMDAIQEEASVLLDANRSQ